MTIFVLAVAICSILSFIVTNQLWFQPAVRGLLSLYAKVSSVILNLLGQSTQVISSQISSASFAIDVKKGCDALAPMLLLTFGTLFFPAGWKDKVKGLLVGISLLALINTIRIVSLFLIGKYTNAAIFDLFHVDIWQIFFILFALLIWIRWLKNATLNVQKA